MGLEPWDLCKQAGCFVRVRVQAAHLGPERVAPCTLLPRPVSSLEASHLFTLKTLPPLLWSSAAILLPLCLGLGTWASKGWPHCLPGSRQPRQSPAQGPPLSQNSKVGKREPGPAGQGPSSVELVGEVGGLCTLHSIPGPRIKAKPVPSFGNIYLTRISGVSPTRLRA